MIPALGAGGSEFDSRVSPLLFVPGRFASNSSVARDWQFCPFEWEVPAFGDGVYTYVRIASDWITFSPQPWTKFLVGWLFFQHQFTTVSEVIYDVDVAMLY
jgi:hypothetical protein